MRTKAISFSLLLLAAACLVSHGLEAHPKNFEGESILGEAFGKPVTKDEFFYYYKTALLFSRTGKEDKSEEDVRQEAWQNLIFAKEAQNLGISVSGAELEEELRRLLKEKGVEYGTADYRLWVITKIGDDVGVFENRIRDLLVINKFMSKAYKDFEPQVTEDEMRQKFLNQYNSFESEYIKFDTKNQAEEFLKDVKKNRRLWKEMYDEKKALGQKGAAWINIMSLEALIDLWKIPKEEAYKIHSMNPGDFTAAEFFYGDAVFRLLQKKEADIAKYDDKKKEYYRDMLTKSRWQRGVKNYFEELFKRAAYRDYVKEKERSDKIEDMKNKSLVELKTNAGIIRVKLFPELAPLACENFIGLVEKGYYDGIIFHRVIKDFMIQAGDPEGTGASGESIWGKPFQNEISEEASFDRPWLMAMANAGPNTNTSQFFITTKPAPWLNGKHTIFGEVAEGEDVVKKIESSQTDKSDKPKTEQKIIRAYIVKKGI